MATFEYFLDGCLPDCDSGVFIFQLATQSNISNYPSEIDMVVTATDDIIVNGKALKRYTLSFDETLIFPLGRLSVCDLKQDEGGFHGSPSCKICATNCELEGDIAAINQLLLDSGIISDTFIYIENADGSITYTNSDGTITGIIPASAGLSVDSDGNLVDSGGTIIAASGEEANIATTIDTEGNVSLLINGVEAHTVTHCELTAKCLSDQSFAEDLAETLEKHIEIEDLGTTAPEGSTYVSDGSGGLIAVQNAVYNSLPSTNRGSVIVSNHDGCIRSYYWDGSAYIAVPNDTSEEFEGVLIYSSSGLQTETVTIPTHSAYAPTKGVPVAAIVQLRAYVNTNDGISNANASIYRTATGLNSGARAATAVADNGRQFDTNEVRIPLTSAGNVILTSTTASPIGGAGQADTVAYLIGYKY